MTHSLAHSEVLLLDCQTTGASPARGQLLEIAWCRTTAHDLRAGRRPDVHAHLVALDDGVRLPRRIAAITGISGDDVADAAPARDVWGHVHAALEDLGRSTGGDPVPVVAHFARFERAFVADLYERHADGSEPAIDWVCTHEIACRLLPGLPRRGLKAVAGYFGHVVREGKRATDHVLATLDVWSEVVHRLDRDAGVSTLPHLKEWMERTPATRTAGRDFAVSREQRLRLPDAPGVYRMLGSRRQLLYVGKATSLRRRVNSYFQKRRHAADRTLEMLTQVYDVEVTETATALEAALLESDAIKEHAPPYNVALRGRQDAVFFAAADLSDVRPDPDALHRLGPLPRRQDLDAWRALGELLGDPACAAERRARFARALGLDGDVPLDLVCAQAGLEAFAAEHDLWRGDTPLRRRLLGIGARAWRERRDALAAEDDAPEPVPDDESQQSADDDVDDAAREPWTPQTPEQVVSLLNGTVLRGAHLIRRAAWLRRLSECSLVWETAGRGDGKPWRLLCVRGGEVAHAAEAEPGPAAAASPAPIPGDHGRTTVERCLSFDVATLDRLRVLTTELRRLVTSGRRVELCLGPRHRLDRAALARRLYWL